MARNRVSATETSMEILDALARLGGAGVTEVATEVEGSKANVHKHLKTLEAAGLVRQSEAGYTLGLRFLEFATAARETESVYVEGKPHIAKLAEVAGAPATLVVQDGPDCVYIHTVAPADRAADPPSVGRRVPLYEAVGGLAILSCYPPDRREQVLSELVDSTDHGDAIEDRLDRISRRGTAVRDDGDGVPQEVVAPVTTGDGRPAGAVGLWQPTTDDDGRRVETDLRKLVRNTATVVSNRLTITR